MRALALERKPHGQVEVDLCPGCRGLWFDAYESLQLTPEATLVLFREVAALAASSSQGRTGAMACPRCRRTLTETRDVQRTTRFAYWRCLQGHGRFTPFLQFMREKDYVRPLTAEEIAHVRAQIGTLHCSGCGAPVDLSRDAACRYCGARIEAIDPDAVRRAIERGPPRHETRPPAPGADIDRWLASQRHAASGAPAMPWTVDLVVGGLAGMLSLLDAR
jgi:DNA-directed RNA polymerase subunit RPC12/RpoP